MNIPYAQFYKAAGVDSASEIDAVTSATKSKTRAGNLAAGSYHVNADGTDITGVSFPVKVLTPWALKNEKQITDADNYDITVKLRGKDTTYEMKINGFDLRPATPPVPVLPESFATAFFMSPFPVQ